MTGGNGAFLCVDKSGAPCTKNSDGSTMVDQAWNTLRKDIVYLNKQSDLFTIKSAERRRLLQDTINRFYWQIRYGCQNPNCTTPTCLSNQRRQAQGPFRRLTVLSSRTLASFLASQDHPDRHLCPHQPAPKDDSESPTRRRRTKKRATPPESAAVDGTNEEESQISQTDTVDGDNGGALPRQATDGKKNVDIALVSADQGKNVSASAKTSGDPATRGKTKDPKSFTQNLYDTLPWKLLQSLRYMDCCYRWMPLFLGADATANDSRAIAVSNDVKIERARTPFINETYLNALPDIQFNPILDKDALIRYSIIKDPYFDAKNHIHVTSSVDVELQHIGQISETTSPEFLRGSAALSQFTTSNIEALVTVFKSTNSTIEGERRLMRGFGRTGSLFANTMSELHATMRIHAFAIQSITYVLGTTKALLRSFLGSSQTSTMKEQVHTREPVGSHEMVQAFRQLKQIEDYPQHIFPSLWISLGDAFASDRHSRMASNRDRRRPKNGESSQVRSGTQSPSYFPVKVMHDSDAAHIVKIALSALVASVPTCAPGSWLALSKLRSIGSAAPLPGRNPSEFEKARSFMEVMDAYEDELALGLMKRLLRVFITRRSWSEIARAQGDQEVKSSSGPEPLEFVEILLEFLQDDKNELHRIAFPSSEQVRYFNLSSSGGEFPSTPAAIVEWLRTIMLKEWDGKPEVSRWGLVGGAIDFMHCIYHRYLDLGLSPEIFQTSFLSERLDSMEMPVEWLSMQTKRETIHLLSVPFLFEPSALVTYFRAINHAAMSKAFDSSMTMARLMIQMSGVTSRSDVRLYNRLKTAMTSYLVLEIRRDDILTGALNQLWRRERRELMKPLKVRMGMDEGEEGVDHGGVQQEFFRLAISEALNPDYGLFTTDPQTKMAWFQPCSPEPVYKFELLGLLISLAIYNGLTLPVTFPLALYRKLLDLPVTNLSHIRDGWPELAKGFDDLLNWSENDVGEVFMRSYAFSVEIPGSNIFVDMEQIGRNDTWPANYSQKGKGKAIVTNLNSRGLQDTLSRFSNSPMLSTQPSSDGGDSWIDVGHLESTTPDLDAKSGPQRPAKKASDTKVLDASSPPSEPGMVTNANRESYVEDYVFWLTDKSIRPQYEAFARGFFVCVEKKALSIFTPEALRTVVEGIQEIDVDELEKTARYENGYSASHRVIRDFWEVVRSFSPDKIRRLLAFVTASDRIPVNGIRSIMFVIQRNGTEDERLPTSLTCFGRLLLPEYSTKKRLKDRLRVALENSQGFGVA